MEQIAIITKLVQELTAMSSSEGDTDNVEGMLRSCVSSLEFELRAKIRAEKKKEEAERALMAEEEKRLEEEEEDYDWICEDCDKVGGYNEDHAEETDEIGFTQFWCRSCYGKNEKLPNDFFEEVFGWKNGEPIVA